MNTYNHLKVFYHNKLVGTLTKTPDRLCAFEYDSEWMENGFSISPFSLPLKKELFIPNYVPFKGLFGVFNDSFHDGFTKILDKVMLERNMHPNEVDNFNRLAIAQENIMGALIYKPESLNLENDFEQLAQECSNVIQPEYDNLDELYNLYHEQKGIRHKILTKINGEDWIIKFPLFWDSENYGEREYKYSLYARTCGIKMCETKLFESNICSGYFGTKRFDRESGEKVHTVSAGGLLEITHRMPSKFDYNDLFKLTSDLTKNYQDIEQLYKLMCFNVFANNRDDHLKNFSYFYDENKKEWHLAPAYDITLSWSFKGEHATKVNGSGNPTLDDILAVAKNTEMDEKLAKDIALDIKDKCSSLQDIKAS